MSTLFYGSLAPWWPLISPVADYAEEAASFAALLHEGSTRSVLELGSGGGHNAAWLKRDFAMTLVDLSPDMLDVSRRLNPECEHLEGDMRAVRLGRTFDAVFVHDAIDSMCTEEELRAAIETAFVHCKPGGLALFVPDHTTERFEPSCEVSGGDDPDGRGVRLLEWTLPLEPGSTQARTEYVFTLRQGDGRIDVAHETHTSGVFPERTWLELLTQTGFVAESVPEVTTEARAPRTLFLCRRPFTGPVPHDRR